MNRHRPYCSQTAQIFADMIRVDTCDTRRFMNPLLGISPAHTTAPGYCHASPDGDNGVIRPRLSNRALVPNGADGSPTIVHCSFYIVHCWTFTFSAKERDSETGLSYFGSRYYSSDLSIWLSVDPMSDKYASLSPYTYCANNPVKLVDPNGEEIFVGEDYYYRNGYLYYKGTEDIYVPEQGSFEEKALNSLNKLQSTKQGSELITPFEGKTGKDVIIKNSSDNPHTPGKVQVNDYIYSHDDVFKSATIYWNPEGDELFKTLEPNATTDLGHEFSHVYDKANGTTYPTDNVDNCPRNEWQAVYRENMIRKELGVPYRRGYRVLLLNNDGTKTPYFTKMLTSGGLPYVP